LLAGKIGARSRTSGQSEDPMGVNFTGIKVFSTTLARDRENMGENITKWIKENQNLEIVDRVVMQSSDKEFHCLTITLFYRTRA
jgi:hypothetical protein